jgi:hypothetical protein
MKFVKSIAAWDTQAFSDVFKREAEQLAAKHLPLQQSLSSSSHALDEEIQVMVIKTSADDHAIHVTAGIFYQGVIAGCNCADDPSSVDENTEYCEVRFDINKASAETTITSLP